MGAWRFLYNVLTFQLKCDQMAFQIFMGFLNNSHGLQKTFNACHLSYPFYCLLQRLYLHQLRHQ